MAKKKKDDVEEEAAEEVSSEGTDTRSEVGDTGASASTESNVVEGGDEASVGNMEDSEENPPEMSEPIECNPPASQVELDFAVANGLTPWQARRELAARKAEDQWLEQQQMKKEGLQFNRHGLKEEASLAEVELGDKPVLWTGDAPHPNDVEALKQFEEISGKKIRHVHVKSHRVNVMTHDFQQHHWWREYNTDMPETINDDSTSTEEE